MKTDGASRFGGRIAVLAAGLGLAALAVATVASCGAASPAASPSSSPLSTLTVQSGTTSTAASPSQSSTTSAVAPVTDTTFPGAGTSEELFVHLAGVLQPTTVFAPVVLPEGAVLADQWLPVLESARPLVYDGPREPNPYVIGSGADAEIQAVFEIGRGWLVVIENFQGDLGDVPAVYIGEVEGSPAALYEVNGGDLVQWSYEGRWYGVFGRDVRRDAVLATALGMEIVRAERGSISLLTPIDTARVRGYSTPSTMEHDLLDNTSDRERTRG